MSSRHGWKSYERIRIGNASLGLFAPGSIIAYVTHSAIWMFITPAIFVVLMILFILMLK